VGGVEIYTGCAKQIRWSGDGVEEIKMKRKERI
jgi:hypothetical protein